MIRSFRANDANNLYFSERYLIIKSLALLPDPLQTMTDSCVLQAAFYRPLVNNFLVIRIPAPLNPNHVTAYPA